MDDEETTEETTEETINTNHVVMLPNTSTIKCMHCGMTYDINVPCPSSVFVAILNAFVESHKDCEARDD